MIAFAALCLPTSAQAHATTIVTSLDFVARVVSTGRDPSVIHARIDDGDRKLELRVSPPHTVLVLGYAGEPFLRFSPAGVDVNDRSPTAVADKLARGASAPALTPRAHARWSFLTGGDRFAWHDHRLGPVPARRYGDGEVATWAIPLVVDGRPDLITGRLWHGRGPPVWIWLGVFGLALVAAAPLSRQQPDRAARTVFICAGVAGTAALVLSIGLSLGPGLGAWEGVPTTIVVAVAAVAVFRWLPQARGALAGLVGLVAALVGLGDAGVLVHGYVISPLPAAVIRAAAATAVASGLVAAVTVAARHLAGSSAPSRHRRPARLSVPRGRSR